MFKKLSVFIDAEVRSMMQREKFYAAQKSCALALNFVHEVVAVALWLRASDDDLQKPFPKSWLWNEDCWMSFGHLALRQIIQEAYRIESYVSYKDRNKLLLMVQVNFFLKGSMTSKFTIEATVHGDITEFSRCERK